MELRTTSRGKTVQGWSKKRKALDTKSTDGVENDQHTKNRSTARVENYAYSKKKKKRIYAVGVENDTLEKGSLEGVANDVLSKKIECWSRKRRILEKKKYCTQV